MRSVGPGRSLRDLLVMGCQSLLSPTSLLCMRVCRSGCPDFATGFSPGNGKRLGRQVWAATANNCSSPKCFVVLLVLKMTIIQSRSTSLLPSSSRNPFSLPGAWWAVLPQGLTHVIPFLGMFFRFGRLPLFFKVWPSLQQILPLSDARGYCGYGFVFCII